MNQDHVYAVGDRVCITKHNMTYEGAVYGTVCKIYEGRHFSFYRVKIDEESKRKGFSWMEDMWLRSNNLCRPPCHALNCDMAGVEELI